MARFFKVFVIAFVLAFCAVFAMRSCSLACDNMPIFSVFNKYSHQRVIDADVARYDHRLGLWYFTDKVQNRTIEVPARDVIVTSMGGEYSVRGDGHVVYRSSATHRHITLLFDPYGFSETTIDERLDNQLMDK